MILNIPSIIVDGKELASGTKINLQVLRRKARLVTTVSEHPVDILINRWGDPTLSKLSVLAITINGEEMKSKQKFEVKLGFNFMKHVWSLTGMIGTTKVDESMNKIIDVIKLIPKYFK